MEVSLQAEDKDTFLPYDLWEDDVFQRYEKKFKAVEDVNRKAQEERVKTFLLQFAKMKQKEPLFKAKKRILEQQEFIDKPISRTYKEIAEKGMRNARENLRKQYGLDYVGKKFIKVKE
jgi:hypothetical protein